MPKTAMPKTAKSLVVALLLGAAALGTVDAAKAAPRPRPAATVSADAAPATDPGDMTWG